jgi:putative phosphoesterase
MKIGILSDAHGNWKALEKCLNFLRRFEVDAIYFLGDAVGYLPSEDRVLDLLRDSRVRCQKGNHEVMLLGTLPLTKEKDQVYGLMKARKRISKENLSDLQVWPESRSFSVDGRNVLMVHGSPTDTLEGYVYPDDDFSFAAKHTYDAIFFGHTHYPFVSKYRKTIIANVGSCGLPRDQGDMAAFTIYDSTKHLVNVYRVALNCVEIVKDLKDVPISQSVLDCFKRSTGSFYGEIIQ